MDQFRHGVFIFLGTTGGDLRPVTAILSYMVLWGQDTDPFFSFANGDLLNQD